MKAIATAVLLCILTILPTSGAAAMDDHSTDTDAAEEGPFVPNTPQGGDGSSEDDDSDPPPPPPPPPPPADPADPVDPEQPIDLARVGADENSGEDIPAAAEPESRPGAGSSGLAVSASRSAQRAVPWTPPCYETRTRSLGIDEETGASILDTYCFRRYSCASERIDDVVSGHIEGEADGAYSEYVVGFAARLDEQNATLIEIESNPVLSEGETSPIIPLASDENGISQLTEALAENGLGEDPGQLFLPLFTYCRRGVEGEIETDPAAEDEVRARFGWVALNDEFDIPAASLDTYGEVERRILAQRPALNSIPPMEDGIAIVRFPMWLWLEDYDTEVIEVATSEPNGTVQVTGRATFDHVLWQLGDNEIRCEIDDMVAYEPGMDLRSRDARPDCHHIFTTLVEFQAQITLVYNMEQQVATRRSPNHPYAATAWEPHPNGAQVSAAIAGPQISVEEIYAVNVPFDG